MTSITVFETLQPHKSLHTCLKWMDNAFHSDGCPYFGHLIQSYQLGEGNFCTNQGEPRLLAAIMVQLLQGRDIETSPTPPDTCYAPPSLNDG